jgi:hypothetical protein
VQALFAANHADEIDAVQRQGGKAAVRAKLADLPKAERRVLREALDELEVA